MTQSFEWRTAFFFVGIPGLLLGVSAIRLPEPHCDQTEQRCPHEFVRMPALPAILVAGWFRSFAGYAYFAWGRI
jgi:predicted MFS family arabinose efflux permease